MSFQIDKLKLAVIRATEEKRKIAQKFAKLSEEFANLKRGHDYYQNKWNDADVFEHWLLNNQPAIYSIFTRARIEYYKDKK